MNATKYEIVPHDGGWAYRSGDGYSETFPSHDDALQAALIAAREHQSVGDDVEIEYQDGQGRWRQEHSDGKDRPETEVVDHCAGSEGGKD
ncbi:DUF2188 domain-containing protein [Ensifer adhaerens]|uniref:DUF2188 domain-containing protein n=1 Tax=Ensifer adhaerens TaxID=106592 RepID=UPI0015688F95